MVYLLYAPNIKNNNIYYNTMTIKILHRGWFGKLPENSLIAFHKAFKSNFDGIETDIQLTNDNIWVLHHDDTLNRLFNLNKKMNQYKYKEIGKIIWNNELTSFNLTKLDELIELNKKYNKVINLEIKVKLNETSPIALYNLLNITNDNKKYYNELF